jgi:hypothetical protein
MSHCCWTDSASAIGQDIEDEMKVKLECEIDTASDLFLLIYADEHKFLSEQRILRYLGLNLEMDVAVLAWERSARVVAEELGSFVPRG